jgi:hypothetical protein
MRALPPETAAQVLRTFQVTQPFDVQAGVVAPAFNQIGLGTQIQSSIPLGDLLSQGYLTEIAP